MKTNHTCRGCLSRRQCLQYIGTAAASVGALTPVLGQAKQVETAPGNGTVDPASLRPRPRVRMHSAFLEMPRPYWLGWPGTTYDLDKHQARYSQQYAESCKRLGVDGSIEPAPISADAGVRGFVEKARRERPDAVLLILQHMNCWGWADLVAREAGVPVIIFSPIGTSFTGHVLEISRRPGVHVVSTLEWPAVETAMRMVRAKRMFEESRILWIHGNQRAETVLDRLGTKVRQIPRDTFNKHFQTVAATTEVRDLATDLRKGAKKIVEPNWNDTVNAMRAYVTAKELLREERSHALSMDCLGMVGDKLVPTPPCAAWTLLQDQGITAGCEADLFGATSLMMTSYLLDRPGYMNDPVAETSRNLLIVAHCTSGTRIAGFDKPRAPYVLRDHSESALGVAMQVIWPVGAPVTLVRMNSPHEMIVDTGKVVYNVDTPPAGGCRTSVALQMDRVDDCRDVAGFHQVVTLGDHRRTLEAFGQMYGIRVVHSPEHSA